MNDGGQPPPCTFSLNKIRKKKKKKKKEEEGRKKKARRALGRAHLPPTKVF